MKQQPIKVKNSIRAAAKPPKFNDRKFITSPRRTGQGGRR